MCGVTGSNGNPIDDSGGLSIQDSQDATAVGTPQLARILANSDAAHSCMVLQAQRFALARQEVPADTCSLLAAAQHFHAANDDVRELMIDLVTQPTFRFRPAQPKGASDPGVMP